jgi:hypothetical protein
MAKTQRAHDLAEFQVTGQLGSSVSPENQRRADLLAREILENDTRQDIERRDGDGSDWNKHVLEHHLSAAKSLGGLSETPLGAYGFVPMFSGYITGTWSAIESMIADLWEAALNTHPRALASLNGKPRKATYSNDPERDQSRSRDQDGPKIDLNLVARHDFDLRKCMGTIFRSERRYGFTRLSGAREAYMRAFPKKNSPRVDSAIESKSLDILSAVRNVLLHRAGEADDEYVRQQQQFLTLPKAGKGEKIRLNGQNTSEIIKSAIASSKSLMIAVDDWIADN